LSSGFTIFGKLMGLSMIKNCFIFILAPIIFMQYGNSKLLHSTSAHYLHSPFAIDAVQSEPKPRSALYMIMHIVSHEDKNPC
jgi:hypothetical protein